MKNILSIVCGLSTVALIASPAMAHHNKGGGQNQPCKAVWKACTQAGKEGKDAKQCVETVKGGGTVEGVSVSDTDLKACQSNKS